MSKNSVWDFEEREDGRTYLWRRKQAHDKFAGVRLGTELWFGSQEEQDMFRRAIATVQTIEEIAGAEG